MMKFNQLRFPRHVTAILGGLALAVATVGASHAYPGEQYGPQAKVSYDAAQKMALKVQPGKVTAGELEQEAGGSGLRFSFDILTQAGVTHEVGVDAANGKILENSVEGANPD